MSPPSLYVQQQRESQYHLKNSLQNEHSSSIAKNVNAYRSESKEKELKALNQLNGKSSDFKIPSGKEGSLKHRILIRPDLTAKPLPKTSSSSSSSLLNGQHSSITK